jgi:hypothetical protein
VIMWFVGLVEAFDNSFLQKCAEHQLPSPTPMESSLTGSCTNPDPVRCIKQSHRDAQREEGSTGLFDQSDRNSLEPVVRGSFSQLLDRTYAVEFSWCRFFKPNASAKRGYNVPEHWTFAKVIDADVDHSCQLVPGCISERHELRDDRGTSDASVHTMVLGKSLCGSPDPGRRILATFTSSTVRAATRSKRVTLRVSCCAGPLGTALDMDHRGDDSWA